MNPLIINNFKFKGIFFQYFGQIFSLKVKEKLLI